MGDEVVDEKKVVLTFIKNSESNFTADPSRNIPGDSLEDEAIARRSLVDDLIVHLHFDSDTFKLAANAEAQVGFFEGDFGGKNGPGCSQSAHCRAAEGVLAILADGSLDFGGQCDAGTEAKGISGYFPVAEAVSFKVEEDFFVVLGIRIYSR